MTLWNDIIGINLISQTINSATNNQNLNILVRKLTSISIIADHIICDPADYRRWKRLKNDENNTLKVRSYYLNQWVEQNPSNLLYNLNKNT